MKTANGTLQTTLDKRHTTHGERLMIYSFRFLPILSVLLLFIAVSCNKPTTYQIGSIRNNPKTILNNFSNSIDAKDGYLTMRDCCRIHYFTEGIGEPILVIHGGPGEPYKKQWEGLKLLNNSYSFIYYDQRGCGKSTRLIDKFTSGKWNSCQPELYKRLGLESALQDVEEIRKILGTNKITLIGHSYGCIIAALYSIEFPDNVKKLILVSPAPAVRSPLGNEFDYSKVIEKELSSITKKEYDLYRKDLWNFDVVITKDEKELSEQNKKFFYFYDEYHRAIGLTRTVSLIDNLVDKENIGGWLPYAYGWSFPSEFDYRNNLRSIKVPTLIVWGGMDLCKESWVKEYSDFIPDTKTAKIEGCSHFLFEDDPEGFSRIVSEFLKEKNRLNKN
jgi:proline iminopeptidase